LHGSISQGSSATRFSLGHGGFLLAVLVAFSHLQSAGFGAASPYPFVRKIPYVIPTWSKLVEQRGAGMVCIRPCGCAKC
jgi:hypothetical protein